MSVHDSSHVAVVPAAPHHLPALQPLARLAYGLQPGEGRWWFPPLEFQTRLAIFPEGQFIALDTRDNTVIGYTSALRFHFDPDRPFVENWDDVTDCGWLATHRADGEWMYGVDSFVHPDWQGAGVGSMLMAARFAALERLNLRGLVGGSLIMGYGDVADSIRVEQYVQDVIAGARFDPNLSKQLRKGFTAHDIIPNYTTDPRSRNYGVTIVWRNPAYRPKESQP